MFFNGVHPNRLQYAYKWAIKKISINTCIYQNWGGKSFDVMTFQIFIIKGLIYSVCHSNKS